MALGRGLGSLIPQKKVTSTTKTTQIKSNKETSSNVIEDVKEGVNFVPTNKIIPNPMQPRLHFSPTEMEELVSSIKHHGILQPLVVSPLNNGTYELIAGERRLRASKLANLNTVPVLIKNVTDHEKLELAMIENLQRHDLNAIEEAKGYKQLMDDFNFTQEEVSKKMGKSRPVVANMMRLLKLPTKIQNALMSGRISTSGGRVLAGITDSKQQEDLFNKMLDGLTVRESEVKAQTSSTKHSKRQLQSPLYADLEQKLMDLLGTRVNIKKSGKTGKLVVEFYSDDELQKIVKNLNC